MKNTRTRLFSAFLALVMLAAMLPAGMTALAEDAVYEEAAAETTAPAAETEDDEAGLPVESEADEELLAAGPLSSVAITSLNEPYIGGVPDTVITVPAGVTVKSVEWSPEAKAFVASTAYTVTITLNVKKDYSFVSALTATINGKAATVTVKSAGEAVIAYTFPATPKIIPTITYGNELITCRVNDVVKLTATHYMEAAGIENLKYQWFSGATSTMGSATPILGATNATCTVPTSGAGSAYYFCRVTAKYYGANVDSFEDPDAKGVQVVVSPIGYMTITPATAQHIEVKYSSTPITFDVSAANVTNKTLSYSWYACDKDGVTSGEELGVTKSFTVNGIKAADKDKTFYYKVTVTATLADETTETASLIFSCILKPDGSSPIAFTDVRESDYFYGAVVWAVAAKVTVGTTATTFSPNTSCTRGQVISFIWRAAGCPEPKTTTCPFTDVKPDQYYYKAVLWGVENEIVFGVSETSFQPNAGVTRGAFVTFLWRYVGHPTSNAKSPFWDVQNSGYYYYDAVMWAVENGVAYGYDDGHFHPDYYCNRGQVVSFMSRYFDK